jgi:hypothetical protein
MFILQCILDECPYNLSNHIIKINQAHPLLTWFIPYYINQALST